MNILFVCSQGKIRSRTACMTLKAAWNEVKFCGTDNDADVPITYEMVEWADVVVCMEKEHQDYIAMHYSVEADKVQTWSIPDKFYLLEDELCFTLKRKAMDYLEGY